MALPIDVLADPPPYLRVASKPLRLVAGGARRQDSVANAFAVVSEEADVIVIHDAARPFVSDDLIERTIAAAVESGAAMAALPARDTVKQPCGHRRHGDARGSCVRRWPRDEIYLAQTPQAFRREVLRDALALVGQGHEVTDEAALAERAGHPVRTRRRRSLQHQGHDARMYPIAEVVAASGARPRADGSGSAARPSGLPWRIGGTGYDLHRLVEGRR